MKPSTFAPFRSRCLPLTLVVLLVGMIANVAADTDACPASAEYNFLCGPGNAEDLVLVPDTKWIIASGMAPGASIYLIDSQQKTWSALYPADAPRARQDMAVFGACPGSPDPNHFVSHGLNLRPGAGGHSTLYVVGHGGREAIEVFDVDATGSSPALTWTGCVEMPEGMVANSVASFSDGSLVATVPLHPDKEIADAIAGEVTGAVYHWSPGDAGFTIIPGTELPYANGIEVSSDGREIYVASSGLLTVTAFSNSRPARALRVTEPMAIVPDNLHMAADGSLVTAGLVADDPRCGNVQGPAKFDLKEFASCPRPFMALAIDPQSMDGTVLAAGSAHEQFSNITMALQVGGELWLGSFAGDRIAYRSLEESD
jgi:sugar lactone lactonase YvrE